MLPIRTAPALLAAVAAFFAVLAHALPAASQRPGNDRAVLVTGASSGIGLRMTEVLSEHGFYVYAGARSADDLARLDAMENVSSVRLDVTDPEEIEAAVRWVGAQRRGLYGLINNAGVAVVGSLVDQSADDVWFQQDVNVMGPFRVTRAFVPMLLESEGRIMTTGSISGILSGAGLGAYSMSKHAVEAYTDALAADLAGTGVEVSVVEPGNYRSDILVNLMDRLESQGFGPGTSEYDEMVTRFGGDYSRSDAAEPDDVALAALDFLVSDTPKRRYLVVPVEREARITIEKIMREMLEMNLDQPFSYTRDELVEMLDELMAVVEASRR